MNFKITPATLTLLDLADNATPDQVELALQNLVDKAKKADTLQADVARQEKELKDLKDAHAKESVEAILKQGLADKKLTRALADKLGKSYAGKPEELKDLVDTMPAQTIVAGGGTSDELPEKYRGKSFHDLYVSGELAQVKKDFPEHYETLKTNK